MKDCLKKYLKRDEYHVEDALQNSKWNFSKARLESNIVGEGSALTDSILRQASIKMVGSLRSKKDWVQKKELTSEKVKTDFGLIMAAEFCVIIHVLKRKLGRDLQHGRDSKTNV